MDPASADALVAAANLLMDTAADVAVLWGETALSARMGSKYA
jgi:hypothetical protein